MSRLPLILVIVAPLIVPMNAQTPAPQARAGQSSG